MSRVGRAPLVLPPDVTLHVADARVRAEGPKGKLERSLDGDVTVTVEGNAVRVTRRDDSRRARSIHGLTRVLVGRMVEGVTKGFTRVLEIN
ncbi:MAG: 50S ribosomal protein L6, partial [Deltaproteobacteria bacterium]